MSKDKIENLLDTKSIYVSTKWIKNSLPLLNILNCLIMR